MYSKSTGKKDHTQLIMHQKLAKKMMRLHLHIKQEHKCLTQYPSPKNGLILEDHCCHRFNKMLHVVIYLAWRRESVFWASVWRHKLVLHQMLIITLWSPESPCNYHFGECLKRKKISFKIPHFSKHSDMFISAPVQICTVTMICMGIRLTVLSATVIRLFWSIIKLLHAFHFLDIKS